MCLRGPGREKLPVNRIMSADDTVALTVRSTRRSYWSTFSCFDDWAKYLLSHHDELEIVERRYGKDSTSSRVLEALHSMPVQMAGLVLLSLDVMIIITELYLDIHFPSCQNTQRDGISCCPAPGLDDATSLCGAGLQMERSFVVVCEARPAVKVAHSALIWTSVTIGLVFLLEVLAQLLILQLAFLRNPLYVVDMLIIVVALVLEISLYMASYTGQAALSGLLMLSRSWRFVRIGHALYTMSSMKKELRGQHQHSSESSSSEELQASAGKAGPGTPDEQEPSVPEAPAEGRRRLASNHV